MSTERKTYNGWTNYETWIVNLWIDNDQSDSDYWKEWAEGNYRQASADETFTRKEKATFEQAEMLKEHFENNNPVGDQCNVWGDLMGAALSEVNWHEIAEHMIAEVDTDAIDAESADDDSEDGDDD